MDTITHALLPVIFTKLAAGKNKWPDRRGYIGIGLAGALPDLLNPHLSLEARMTSWSHGIPCWLALSAMLLICSAVSRGRLTAQLTLLLSGSYLLHIMCDAISGGVNFLYPFGNWTWGEYWVDPLWWVPLDIVCTLACYFMFRIIPLWNARKVTPTGSPK